MGPARLACGHARRNVARVGRSGRSRCSARTACGGPHLGEPAASARSGRRADVGFAGFGSGGRAGSFLGSSRRACACPCRQRSLPGTLVGSSGRACSGVGCSRAGRGGGAGGAFVESASGRPIVGSTGRIGATCGTRAGVDRLGRTPGSTCSPGASSASYRRPGLGSSGGRRASTAARPRLGRARACVGSAQDRGAGSSAGAFVERPGRSACPGSAGPVGAGSALERSSPGLVRGGRSGGSCGSFSPFDRRRPRRRRGCRRCPRGGGAARAARG
jgi:hypothetical protein